MKFFTFNRLAFIFISSTMMIFWSNLESVSETVTTSSELQSLYSESAVLKNQLQEAQKNLSSRNLPIKIVSISFLNRSLQSTDEVSKLQNQLISAEAIVPQYDGLDPNSFALNTIQERTVLNATDSSSNQNVVSNIRSEVFPIVKTGQHTVDITWESRGKLFHTTCIYDKNGIVYDNILSNIVLIHVNNSEQTQARVNVPGGTSSTQSLDQSASKKRSCVFTYRPMYYELDWPWGSKRGEITVDHTIIWNCSNYAFSQNGDPNGYMTLGKAEATAKPTILSNKNGYAILAFGYAWATPSANANIKFSFNPKKESGLGGSFDVSVSSIGSSGRGDNHSTITF